MPDNKERLDTVCDYEICIYNASRTLHLHYPISGSLFRAEQFADIVGRRHAEKQKTGDTVTVMICREINGSPCAIWHRRYHDPAAQLILKNSEKEPNAQKAPTPHHS